MKRMRAIFLCLLVLLAIYLTTQLLGFVKRAPETEPAEFVPIGMTKVEVELSLGISLRNYPVGSGTLTKTQEKVSIIIARRKKDYVYLAFDEADVLRWAKIEKSIEDEPAPVNWSWLCGLVWKH